jgi:hypothetical protein
MSFRRLRVVGSENYPAAAQISTHQASCAPEESPCCDVQRVTVALGELVPLLLHASQSRRAWLSDFSDESLEISQDLYEVLLAYERLVKSSHRRAA